MTDNLSPIAAFVAQFKAARRVSAPIVAVSTADPEAALTRLADAANVAQLQDPLVLLKWDRLCGIRGVRPNHQGDRNVALKLNDGQPQAGLVTGDTTNALIALRGAPPNAVVFFTHPHMFFADPLVVQAIWNLRDEFKTNHRMLVLLNATGVALPMELQQDVVILREPLPERSDLESMIEGIADRAGVEELPDGVLRRTADAVSGLSMFAAEQVSAMSVRMIGGQVGIDVDAAWERKRATIEQIPGMSVWRPEPAPDGQRPLDYHVAGCQAVKELVRAVINGGDPFRGVVWIDEIEKAMAAANHAVGDNTGIAQDQEQAILTYMQDRKAKGLLFNGHPGTAKSAIAKLIAAEAGVICMRVDLGKAKSGLAGSSEATIRRILDVVDSVTGGRALFVATSNDASNLKPELLRRFRTGRFFFDLPTPTERAAIWSLYMERHGIAQQALPDDEGWTGAEIEECVEKAAEFKQTLVQAASTIVPAAVSAHEAIARRRDYANLRFLSASYPGLYRTNWKDAAQPVERARAIVVPVSSTEGAFFDHVTGTDKKKAN